MLIQIADGFLGSLIIKENRVPNYNFKSGRGKRIKDAENVVTNRLDK